MPEAQASKTHTLSPADMVLKLIEEMRDKRTMNVQEKLNELAELCVQRIAFNAPEQAMQVITALGQIIESESDPKVRVAALKVMERMMSLEEIAEHKPGAPKMNWTAAGMILDHARQEAECGPAIAGAARDPKIAATSAPGPSTKPSPPLAKTDALTTEPVVAERPHPRGMKLAEEGISPAAFMRILRSVAGTDGEDDVRKVAGRMIETIQKQSVQTAPSMTTPACTEG